MSYINHPLIAPQSVEARMYQQHILTEAIDKNLLVAIPTALGKTIIALLVAAHFLWKGGKVLLMAPTRPLVLQHYHSFLEFLRYPEDQVVALTGKTPPQHREEEWRDARVLFSTPQIVKNDIEKGMLNPAEFSLIVFDEAHRAVKAYAYTYVAQQYVEQSPYPIILGLTASPGGDKDRIKRVCESLFIEKVIYKSEHDEDVKPYVAGTDLDQRKVELPEEYKEVSEVLHKPLDNYISKLVKHGWIRKKAKYVTKADLLSLGKELRNVIEGGEAEYWTYQTVVEQSACLSLFHAIELLETQGMKQLHNFLLKLKDEDKKSYKKITTTKAYSKALELSKKHVTHPKVPLLVETVKEELERNSKAKILVFSQFRDTVKEIVDYLQANGVQVERFVGQANKGEDAGLSQKEQSQVLQRYRDGEFRVLAATSIAEEGLDIPDVDLVIFYEPVPSEIRFIQRKGRTGRKEKGRAILLVTEDTVDMAYFYSSLKRAKKMKKIMQNLNKELQPIKRDSSQGGEGREEPVEPKDIEEKVEDEDVFDLYQVEREYGVGVSEGVVSDVQQELEVDVIDSDFMRDVSRAEKWVVEYLKKALERGEKEVPLQELYDMELFSKDKVKHAVGNLAEGGKVYFTGRDSIAVPVPDNVYDVVVERVYRGGATLLVNNKFRAKLSPEDFPSGGIKKGVKLKVRGKFYRRDNVLCMRVNEVIH